MKPGEREQIPTVAEALTRAAAICDPDGSDFAVRSLIESFEDDERPATAVDDLVGELGSTVGGVDPEGDSPAAAVAAVAMIWLATNMGSADDPDRVLRESVRLGFGDEVPPAIEEWLAARGVDA